ncbi:8bcc8467-228e-4399-b217-41c4d5b437c1-CDS [Sclerotinia trifoliorum]|uniref:8bcc8467-228e-4399-b217-41c4d5b437c1-CDS n=1 Tax=Sclerotinia trifoliorum TaxID=28548 RepID=A0A8H2ZP33_9HELO|nr:8bcc8467-228e-4399-b217-41c4d5b437c1-CDS [Sclerotinia trifoliorum]
MQNFIHTKSKHIFNYYHQEFRHSSIMPPRSRNRSKSPKCHLLALPREIRDEIHRYVQWSRGSRKPDNTIRPFVLTIFQQAERQEEGHPEARFRPDDEDLLILGRTCEQLYHESNQIFYGENTFIFFHTWGLYCYLYMIGAEKRAYIRQIYCSFLGDERVAAFQLLGECKALKHLTIEVNRMTMYGSRKPQKDLMTAKGVGALRKIRGMENLVVDVVDSVNFYTRNHEQLSRPTPERYFKLEDVQEFEKLLTEEMNMKEEAPKQVLDRSSKKIVLKPKPKSSKPAKVSKTQAVHSGRVKKSRISSTKK